ncbi:O-antigen translocase [Hymenobacter coalescens]
MSLPAAEDDATVTLPAPPSGLARFVRGSLGSGASVLARAGGALALNKLLAVYGGPGGLTLLAHFQNLMALLTTLPNDGVHVGIVKYLAPRRPGSAGWRLWFGTGALLNAAVLLLGFLALPALRGPLLAAFEPTPGWVAGVVAGITLLTAYTYLAAVLLAAQRLRAYVLLTVLLSVLGPLAVAAALRLGWPVPRVLLAYLLAQGLTVVPAAWVCARAGLLAPVRGRLSHPAVLGLGRFLLMALSVLLCSKAVDFAVRDLLIARFSLAQTGLWQAVAKLADNYTMVFSAVMGAVFYPRLAALAGQPAARRRFVRAVFGLLAGVLALGLGALWLLRDVLLPLLFDARFAAARDLLGPQLLGDWAKFLSWTLLYLLMAEARVGRYVLVQVASAAVYAGLLVLLLPRYGLYGATLAHALRFGVLLLACALYFRAYFRR